MQARRGGDPGVRLLRLLIGLTLGLLLCEALVRIVGAAPEVAVTSAGRYRISADPLLIYEPIPNLSGPEVTDNYYLGYPDRTNALGFRGPLYGPAKSADTYRIIVLGDSIADGWGVEHYAETFPAILEAGLRAAGVPAQVMDFGVVGYQTTQEVEMLVTKGLAYHPDLVLVAYCLNDTLTYSTIGRQLYVNAGARSSIEWVWSNRWLVRSALYRLLRYRVRDTTPPGVPERPRTIDGDFAELARLQQASGFRTLVAIFPRFNENFDQYPVALHQEVTTILTRHGLPVLDLLDTMRTCAHAASVPIARDEWHPTAVGHRCAGERLAQEVLRLRERPPPAPQ